MATATRIAKVKSQVDLVHPFVHYTQEGKRVTQFSAALVGAYLSEARDEYPNADDFMAWVDRAIGNTALSTDEDTFDATLLQKIMNRDKIGSRVRTDTSRTNWFTAVASVYDMEGGKSGDELTPAKVLELVKAGHITSTYSVKD